mmetsp:Transcript_43584/g.85979  ORF Transcript_43584/g.85979 Transcript_43584/m.85979 type:complete len:90 (-) Transcript_43584:166-435(-)
MHYLGLPHFPFPSFPSFSFLARHQRFHPLLVLSRFLPSPVDYENSAGKSLERAPSVLLALPVFLFEDKRSIPLSFWLRASSFDCRETCV